MSDTPRTFDTGLTPADLDPERPAPIETPWGSFFLVAVAGEVVAVESWCPHLLAPLFQGSFHGGRVTCPWHGWVFDLKNGACVWAPDDEAAREARLTRLTVTLEAGGYRIHAPDGE